MSIKNIFKNYYQSQHKNFNKDLKVKISDFTTNIKNNKEFSKGTRYFLVEKILKEYDVKKDKIIEIGSVDCKNLFYISKKYRFKKITGIDVAYNEKTSFAYEKFRVNVFPFDFNQKLPNKFGHFDFIICLMVIEHLFDPYHAFSEIKRLLKTDGIAVINLPLVTSFKNRIRLLFGNLPITSIDYKMWHDYKMWDGNHLHYFNLKSIKEIVHLYGLELIQMEPVGSFYYLKKIFPKVLCNELTFAIKKQ